MKNIEYLDHLINLIDKSKKKSIAIKSENYIECIHRHKMNKSDIENYMSNRTGKNVVIDEHIWEVTIGYIV